MKTLELHYSMIQFLINLDYNSFVNGYCGLGAFEPGIIVITLNMFPFVKLIDVSFKLKSTDPENARDLNACYL